MNALATISHDDRRRSLIWAIGITVVLLLAIGGAVAGSVLAAARRAARPGEAATLNAALSTQRDSTGSTAPPGRRAGADAIARLRRLGGMYGEVAFRGKDGATRTLAFERGVVTVGRRRPGGQGRQRHRLDLAVHVQHGRTHGRREGQPLGLYHRRARPAGRPGGVRCTRCPGDRDPGRQASCRGHVRAPSRRRRPRPRRAARRPPAERVRRREARPAASQAAGNRFS